MEFGTMAGIGGVFAAVLVSMLLEGSSPSHIILLPALLLVFVGTFAAAMAGTFVKDLGTVFGGLKKALLGRSADAQQSVEAIISMADLARRQGLLALEEKVRDVEDPLLKQGIELTIDGSDPDEIAEILESVIAAKKGEDKVAIKFFGDMGGYAPTLGIIGTVIGLIHVLGNLSSPDKLGELIAAAFVATLWGVLSANALWLPLSAKLKRMSDYESAQMEMVLEGVLAVQSGTNPRLVEQKLRSLIPAAPAKGAKSESKAA